MRRYSAMQENDRGRNENNVSQPPSLDIDVGGSKPFITINDHFACAEPLVQHTGMSSSDQTY